jgi:hypothetical protein
MCERVFVLAGAASDTCISSQPHLQSAVEESQVDSAVGFAGMLPKAKRSRPTEKEAVLQEEDDPFARALKARAAAAAAAAAAPAAAGAVFCSLSSVPGMCGSDAQFPGCVGTTLIVPLTVQQSKALARPSHLSLSGPMACRSPHTEQSTQRQAHMQIIRRVTPHTPARRGRPRTVHRTTRALMATDTQRWTRPRLRCGPSARRNPR